MLKNYIKVAFRNLYKNKVFSIINILGLAFGLACSIIIALWVWDEHKYDAFHEKKDRLYQTIAQLNFSGRALYWDNSPGILAPTLNDEVAGIEVAIRVSENLTPLISKGETRFKPSGIYADSAFLQVFSFPLTEGDASTALIDPYSIVITQELANYFFEKETALGKSLTVVDFGEKAEYTVTGILDELPKQSTLQFDFIMPYGPYHKKRTWMHSWGNYDDKTYVLLTEGAKYAAVDKQIRGFISEHQGNDSDTQLYLYPFQDVYLKADFSRGLEEGGRSQYVKLFLIIAIMIITIACINFMNLSTARAGKRAKEVGVRKASGAQRGYLILQFLGESIFITLIGILLAVTLVDLLLPFFNTLTGKYIEVPYANPVFIPGLLIFAILVGVIAGSYPAINLSGFQAAKVLKGAAHSGKSLGGLRKALVIFQFTLSIVLIICTIVVYNQIHYVLNKDLGIAKDNIVFHPLYNAAKHHEAYKNELSKIPGIRSVSYSNFNPLNIGNTTGSVSWDGKPDDAQPSFHIIQTDTDFVETFQLQLLQGQNFPEKIDTTRLSFLINQEAADVMEMEDPVGQEISVWGGKGKIYGVINDFHHQNLFSKIDPVIVYYNPTNASKSFIAIDGENVTQTLEQVEELFKKYDQEYPFENSFIEQEYEATYKGVVTAGMLANIFAIIAIIISCLGLFGLASYMTEQRRKETGIRKVFGASIYQLTALFSVNFLKLVIISFIISVPLAWKVMDMWLSDFSYKTEVTYTPFLLGGICAIVVALCTVSYHTLRAAMANPVKSLRYE